MQTTVLNNIVDKVERLYGLQNPYKEMPLLQKAKNLMKKTSPPKSKTPRSVSKNKNQLEISRRSNRNLSISENNSRTTSCSNLDKKPKMKPNKTPDEQSFRLLITKKPKEKVLIKEKENAQKAKKSIDLSEKDFQKTHSSIKSKDFNSSTLNRFHEYDTKKKENLAKLKAEKVDRELKEVKTQTILQTPPSGKRIYERTPEILKKREKEIENLKSLLSLQKQQKEQADQKQAPSRTPSPSRPYSAFYSDMLHWKQKTQNQAKIKALAQQNLQAKELTFKPQLISMEIGRKKEEGRKKDEEGRKREEGGKKKEEGGKNKEEEKKKKEREGEGEGGDDGGKRRVEERLEEWGKGAERRRKELEDQLRPEFKPKICEKSLQMAKTGRISGKMREIAEKSAERRKNENLSKSPNFKLATTNFKSGEKVKREEEGRRREEEERRKKDDAKIEEGRKKRAETENRLKEDKKSGEEEEIRKDEVNTMELESEKRLIREQEKNNKEDENKRKEDERKRNREEEEGWMDQVRKRKEEGKGKEEEDGGRGKEILEKIKDIIREKEDVNEKKVCFKEEAEMFIPIQNEEKGEDEEDIL